MGLRGRDNSCTGWDTFPILRWLLLAAASAPFILAWIVSGATPSPGRGASSPRSSGFAAIVLIAYNGIIDKPSANEIGVSLSLGYWIALLASIGIFGGRLPRVESGGGAGENRPPRFSPR